MKLGERFADVEFRNLVFFDEKTLQIAHPFSRVSHGLVEFILCDAVIAD